MMEQYDKQEAVRFMLKNMDDSAFKPLSGRAEALFAQAVDADIAYIRVIGSNMPYLDEEMLAAFIDEYMELQQRYMEEKGLVEWD